MANESTAVEPTTPTLSAASVSTIAACCLGIGLAIGYLSRESQSTVPSAPASVSAETVSGAAPSITRGHVPSLVEMKQMADRQAAPLLEKLKNDPNDTALLLQVGAIYHTSHQFKEAALYYGKAVQVEPKDAVLRTKLASSLYRDGDVDGAIAQLNQALSYEPTDANSLFNLGMIKLQGKSDARGAIAAWQKLLKTNPQLSPDRKAEVQKLMANVLSTIGDQRGEQGAQAHGRH